MGLGQARAPEWQIEPILADEGPQPCPGQAEKRGHDSAPGLARTRSIRGDTFAPIRSEGPSRDRRARRVAREPPRRRRRPEQARR